MTVFLYGLGDIKKAYACIRYEKVWVNHLNDIVLAALSMQNDYPAIEHVYAVDGDWRIAKAYREAVKSKNFADWIIFKDLLEHRGWKEVI